MRLHFMGIEHNHTLEMMRAMIQWSLFCTADQQARRASYKALMYRDTVSMSAAWNKWKDFYLSLIHI